ncbi:MAG: DUF1614 domain-containing protein [Syntrophomonadaceae bacterium]|nr:DUF1614 domain-containing protein [Syntrophomonadaceae bacterium]
MAASFPAGLVALLAVSILVYFGAAQRVLDRLRLSDKAALVIIGAVIVGSFIDIPLGQRVVINVGGTIFIGLAVWLIVTAGTGFERWRAILASLVTAAVLYLLTRLLGANPEEIVLDPLYIYPLVAAASGYLAGRSRRSAFIAAVLGVFSLDIGRYVFLLRTGTAATVRVGGAGFFDALVLAGILAVVIAEVVGEILERVQGGPRTEGRAPELIKHLQKPQPEPSGFNMEAGQMMDASNPAAAAGSDQPPEDQEEEQTDYDVLLNNENIPTIPPDSDPPLAVNECNAQAITEAKEVGVMINECNVQKVKPQPVESGLINECNVQKDTQVEFEGQEE